MSEHVSILPWAGVAVLAVAAAAWLTGLTRIPRRARPRSAPTGYGERGAVRTGARPLAGLPQQRQSAPHLECVELTPAERAAFAVLARRLADGG
ncbi:hypothetical protein [Streptomyces glaucescens]|uniref:Uncharacterized protein n=1 Tax=Streptomyces glaucescens TaxID=1907 RepID=A0A089X4X3_STRGA|nr:hypothetical protein [Streptomyces glaucescens]AIR98902.1 hypothetical protein SGLAU_14590 [Streptomyces glaucescens]